jgi:hypothetical protein
LRAALIFLIFLETLRRKGRLIIEDALFFVNGFPAFFRVFPDGGSWRPQRDKKGFKAPAIALGL